MTPCPGIKTKPTCKTMHKSKFIQSDMKLKQLMTDNKYKTAVTQQRAQAN